MSEVAIFGKNICKNYREKRGVLKVLKNLNILVLKGQIYGLLGASGSGKTTLLDCITGLKDVDSGDLVVLGHKKPSKDDGFAKNIGYMPQETGLVDGLSIQEHLTYFGIVYNLTDAEIKEKIRFLNMLLHLPALTKMIKTCSGGEKRRVSFAVALINDPELLIMDEPTVGLDTVLRTCIWDYLERLTVTRKTTILITTHYIGEAHNSHVVGFVRNGTIIAEESPRVLLTSFNKLTLEEVFLELCTSSIQDGGNVMEDKRDGSRRRVDYYEKEVQHQLEVSPVKIERNSTTWYRFKAMCYKDFFRTCKDPGKMFFWALLPIIQTYLILHVVGTDLDNLRIAVVNEEAPGNLCDWYKLTQDFVKFDDGTCQLKYLSCYYLEHIDKRIQLIPYTRPIRPDLTNLDDPVYKNVHGVVHIEEKFTIGFLMKVKKGIMFPNQIMEAGFIDFHRTNTGAIARDILSWKLVDAFRMFGESLSSICHEHRRLFTFPLIKPVTLSGDNVVIFEMGFFYPGMALILLFANAMTQASTDILDERYNGFWNRNIIAGISPMEMLCSHLVQCTFFSLLPLFVCTAVASALFDLTIKGSYMDLTCVLMLSSLNGQMMGILISLLCTSFIEAKLITVSIFFPIVYFSGTLWPVESQHYLLQFVVYFLPFAYSHRAMRDIISKGQRFMDSRNFQYGVLMNILWIVALFLIISKRVYSKKMQLVPK